MAKLLQGGPSILAPDLTGEISLSSADPHPLSVGPHLVSIAARPHAHRVNARDRTSAYGNWAR